MRDSQFYQGNCQVAVGQADGQLSQKPQLQLEKKRCFSQVVAAGEVVWYESSQWCDLKLIKQSLQDCFQHCCNQNNGVSQVARGNCNDFRNCFVWAFTVIFIGMWDTFNFFTALQRFNWKHDSVSCHFWSILIVTDVRKVQRLACKGKCGSVVRTKRPAW